MKMTLRWFGERDDSVTLEKIRQIPGLIGVVSSLPEIPVGEVWPLDRIMNLKNEINQFGLELEVIESVNVHEDIKLGIPSREQYIKNYCETIKNLGKAGIRVVCYNFMPVFDWIRTDLSMKLADGSFVMAYDGEWIEKTDPLQLVAEVTGSSQEFSLPGWEPEKLKELKKLFQQYKEINEEKLFANLKYFLEQIIPVCAEYNVRMAIHPDDPPWPIFELPRIVGSKENLERIVNLVDSPFNGLTICSGSLGIKRENDIPEIIRYFGKRGKIFFGHVRNIKIQAERKFYETSHLSNDGSFDMYEIMKAYHDVGFTGYLRPDHGRMIWDEEARPGYGLYDRALGIAYLTGLWEAVSKSKKS